MEAYDMIMLLVLAIATLFGAWKGLAWQIASLSSIFASYFVAYQFRDQVAQMINAEPPWNMFLAMLILYLGCSLVIWVAFRFVSDFIERVKLKEFDRHAGAVLGLSRGVLWCVIITLFAVTLLGDSRKQEIISSKSGYYIAVLLDKSHAIMPEEIHEVVGPYIHSLDQRLGEGHAFPRHHEEGGATAQDIDYKNLLPSANIFDKANAEPPAAAGDAVESWLRKMNESRSNDQQ
jgi:membrane protein required for colicin V production